MFTLPPEECNRRWNNIHEAMEKRALECLIVWGSLGNYRDFHGNLQYLTGVATEGYLVFPLKDKPTLFSFCGGLDTTCWVKDWQAGHPAYSKAISERLRELHLERASIGIVGLSGYWGEMGFPHSTYISINNDLPTANFEDATDIVEKTRRIKSDAEIRCLELACEVGDKVIQSIMGTAKVGVMDYEVRANIMDTLERNSCEPGSMMLYCQGKELVHGGQSGLCYEAASSKVLEYGDVILIEFDATYLGYKAQYNQPFAVGEPSKEWRDIFETAKKSFNSGFEALRPGITVGELDEAFVAPIKEAGYSYLFPAFHGLGLSLEEPLGTFPAQPSYTPNTSFRIEAGMVFEFEPAVNSVDGKKGVHLGIPVTVTETGCRLLSKTWKPELKIV